MFLAMPSRKVAEDEYDDIAHPVNKETRDMFEEVLFDAYEKMKESGEDLLILDL